MLVLTRKADEQILIGDDIKITLVRIKGGSVRIGIEAPREIRVVRGELKKFGGECEAEQTDAVAEVFAHPESQNLVAVKSLAANRIANSELDAIKAAAKTEMFMGTVSRNGDSVKLKRAPLSGFVAAS